MPVLVGELAAERFGRPAKSFPYGQGYRIVATRMPWMAPGDTTDGQPAPLERTVALERLQGRSTAHHLVPNLECSSLPVLVDPDRIEQVLDNLVGNAIKYAPDGGETHVSLGPEDGGLLLSVSDSGIGLPALTAAHNSRPQPRYRSNARSRRCMASQKANAPAAPR